MSNNIPNAATLLEFANLQVAAEALYNKQDINSREIYEENLKTGNTRTSRFTPTQAEDFVKKWEIVSHKANTGTGFSGTLFRAIQENKDAGIKVGDLVISFRSTEFVDDGARDNQATNTFEISNRGWAFGQIADMEKWVKSLNLQDKPISVTGYSLGGHLATAFNLLHNDKNGNPIEDGKKLDITQTFTFNGAGVGLKADGSEMDGKTLADIINQFDINRQDMSAQFTDSIAKQKYDELKVLLNDRNDLKNTESAIKNLKHEVQKLDSQIFTLANINNSIPSESDLKQLPELKERLVQLQTIYSAVDHARMVWEEEERIRTLKSGSEDSADPAPVELQNIDAISIDYQLAVLEANHSTKNVSKLDLTTAYNIIVTNQAAHAQNIFSNFYDVSAATYPSTVAISQIHYGQSVGIPIEDQPLERGDYVSKVYDASTITDGIDGIKLLTNNFAINDFGDTHSIVLIVDSLSVQAVMQKLDPNFTHAQFANILESATNQAGKTSDANNKQGFADGKHLERARIAF